MHVAGGSSSLLLEALCLWLAVTVSSFCLSPCLFGDWGGVTRLFSFQMPAPRRLYLVLIYKHEGPSQAVTIAPELTTQESHTCYAVEMFARPGKDFSASALGNLPSESL